MTESLKSLSDKESKKPRGRKGGRSPLPEDEKKELAHFYLPKGLLKAFAKLVPAAADRSKIVGGWVRAYTIAGGESDRLLAQSSVACEILNYLEATEAPQELRDKLEAAIVLRVSDEVKIEAGAVQVGESWMV